MKNIKEITVFTIGDSNELKTWSNVPYFFSKNLEDKNIIVNRVNIKENSILNFFYKYTFFIILKLLKKKSNHSYLRSGLNYYLTNKKIKAAVKKYKNSNVLLFLTYSFSIKKQSNKKIILFSDWSYLYYINNFLNREALWFERKALLREEYHIKQADAVLSLFPKSLKFNEINYNTNNLYYLGNVINGNYLVNQKQLISLKAKSNKFIFIGNKKYLQGALNLINAFKMLSEKKSLQLELHIIGLNEQQIGINTKGLFYHGYLDKGLKEENDLYYKLLSEARAIINTTENWGSFSAMTEAMYYFTPVITTAYPEFTETYGNQIDFGYYVGQSIDELCSKIEIFLNHSNEKQLELMKNAHKKVKEFTWNNYTEKFLNIIRK